MVRLNIQTVNENGEKTNEASLEGKSLYFILFDVEDDEKKYSMKGSSGFVGKEVPEYLIADSWCKEIVNIIGIQCNHKRLDTAFQLFRLAKLLELESNQLVDDVIMVKQTEPDQKGKPIPDEVIDFLRKKLD